MFAQLHEHVILSVVEIKLNQGFSEMDDNNNGGQSLIVLPIFKEQSAQLVILISTFLENMFFFKYYISFVFMSKSIPAFIACFRIVLFNGTK